MRHPQPAPTRTLPAQPSLIQLRKQAKELLKAYRSASPAAIAEVARYEQHPDPGGLSLVDAQRILARAYGYTSWTSLTQYVDGVHVRAFCAAVESGDLALVRRLAKTRPELVHVSPDGPEGERIALHAAVLGRNAEMTRVLMELGSDARRGIWPHRSASSAYTIARDRGYTEIEAIIEAEEARRQRDLSAPGAQVGAETDEIHRAILQGRCDEAIRLLETDLSRVGACNLRGETPLHAAAWAHEPEMITWLLEHGARIEAKAPFESPLGTARSKAGGKTPLDYAALVAGWSAHGRHFCYLENAGKGPEAFAETVRRLRAGGAKPTAYSAVATGNTEAVLRLHGQGRLENEIHTLRGGLLSIAVRVNRGEMVSLLLDLGLDPDETVAGEDGSPLSWGMPLWFTAMCGRPEIAELLLDRGADVNAVVYASGDALSIAGDTHDAAMTALLRARGARITVEQVAGEQDRESARAILAGRLPAQSLNVDDPSPADLAEQMLWASGGGDPEIVRMCLPHVTREHDDPWWSYVLMHAIRPECFRLVLEHGVDPNVRGEGGYTLLHHLASDYAHEPTREARATLLLKAGASLTLRDPLLKSTPLGWACRWGRIELVRLYLEHGADPVEPEAEPWASPLAWATKGGHREIEALLSHRP